MSGRLFENEPEKSANRWLKKKGQKAGFFAPDKLDKSHHIRKREGGEVTPIPIIRPTLILAQALDKYKHNWKR